MEGRGLEPRWHQGFLLAKNIILLMRHMFLICYNRGMLQGTHRHNVQQFFVHAAWQKIYFLKLGQKKCYYSWHHDTHHNDILTKAEWKVTGLNPGGTKDFFSLKISYCWCSICFSFFIPEGYSSKLTMCNKFLSLLLRSKIKYKIWGRKSATTFSIMTLIIMAFKQRHEERSKGLITLATLRFYH